MASNQPKRAAFGLWGRGYRGFRRKVEGFISKLITNY
jgi:hypothetical protein